MVNIQNTFELSTMKISFLLYHIPNHPGCGMLLDGDIQHLYLDGQNCFVAKGYLLHLINKVSLGPGPG